jgi:peptide/nickel transport system permease protein
MYIYHYTIRRLLYTIPILIGVTLVIFVLFHIVSGDPTAVLLGKHATLQQMEELRRELGLDRSMLMQYLDTLKSAFTLDFGRSWATKQHIIQMIKGGAYASLTLSIPAFVFASLAAIAMALLAAFFRGTLLDRSLVVVSVVMMSISVLAYILFGQWIFAYKLGWFEIAGYEYGFPDFLPYIILPAIIWIVLSIGPDVRLYRTIMLDEVHQDYVRTARAKGLSSRMILFKHVLKNAMIPIITNLVIQVPSLILGALLIENFFGIPGLGNITLQAINNSDFPVIKAMTILSSVLYVIFNVITDILYTLVDPRVQLK